MSQQLYDLDFIPAGTLSEAVSRIGALTGATPERTRGEKRALLALRDALEVDIPTVSTNAHLGAALAEVLGVPWEPTEFVDRTMLTLEGVNALLYGASIAYQEGSLKEAAANSGPKLDGEEWEAFQPAVSKIEAVTRISSLTGSGPEWLGPGSKEHKSVLENLATKLLPHLDRSGLSKTQLGAAIAGELSVPWGDEYISTGETIRLSGLNVLLAGAERMLGKLGSEYAAGLTPQAEGAALVDALWQKLHQAHAEPWDGRKATAWLRDEGTRQENQMEWPGFYFEFRGREILNRAFRPNPFPPRVKYANTIFDYALNHVWDLKSHTAEQHLPLSNSTSRPKDADQVLLNDVDAVRACVDDQGLGFLILSGRGVMDEDGAFKIWHDTFKGKTPTPSLSGKSRTRKAAFIPITIEAFWIANTPALDAAILAGALKPVIQGRQQSGASRPDKFSMKLVPARRSVHVAGRSW
ncbi:hypothetical protein [Microbacterium aurum]|uniref:hypothetical protein n=1 Tax=Microbacterium aurum TaxID=36805 RepID=UPI0012F48023|nr:hypothetical protein [Microbacterium aurum]MBM7827578.1 hypothetical protein [Microbacterium aurum]